MTILIQSDEYQEFKRSNTELKLRVKQWPRNDDNDLTTYIPRLAQAVRKVIYTTNELKELVDKIGGTEEVNKCMEEFSGGMKNLSPLVSNCLGALACTYHRLHGRAAPTWENIEKMWPLCSDSENQGVLKNAVQRLYYNDYLDPQDLNELNVVVNEVASTEKALHYLVGEGVHTKEKFEASDRTLADPNKQYQWDADDESSTL